MWAAGPILARVKAPSAPRASIVIVAYGQRAVTERCLSSLAAALGDDLGARYELVLVDNSSPDDTAELFAAWSDRATVCSLSTNRNFGGGCNAGARAATGEALIFLNNDTVVGPGTLEALAEQALEPGVGAAGLRLLYPDGTLQHAGVGMIRSRRGAVVPHHLFHRDAGDLPAAGATFDLDAVTAACVAVPREVFIGAGGFDEAYANGWEDVDLCLRLRVAGHRVVYRGDLHLVHDEGATRGAQRGGDANAAIFQERWGEALDADDELVGALCDARIAPFFAARPQPAPDGAPVLIRGSVTGISGNAHETRALLAACEAAGLPAAGEDVAPALVTPRLSDAEWPALARARERVVHPAAGVMQVGAAHEAAVLRLAAVPAAPVPPGAAVWASCPAVAAAIIAAGVAPARVHVVAPAIGPAEQGPGGGGILAVLALHDAEASEAPLAALAALGAVVPVRILPVVRTAAAERLVADRLPEAELLAPCSTEPRFAELCATADAVLCAGGDDHFDRRALIAGATGAAVVTLAGGPAAWVLGPGVVGDEEAGSLAGALRLALAENGGRAERREAVLTRCARDEVGRVIRGLLTSAPAVPAPAGR